MLNASATSITPIKIKNDNASILIVGWRSTNSLIDRAKSIITPMAMTTALIMTGAWRLVRESVDILLESTPAHIPLPAVRGQLEAIPGIESVHELHVWSVTPAVVAMSALLLYRHGKNIANLIAGKESRIGSKAEGAKATVKKK